MRIYLESDDASSAITINVNTEGISEIPSHLPIVCRDIFGEDSVIISSSTVNELIRVLRNSAEERDHNHVRLFRVSREVF